MPKLASDEIPGNVSDAREISTRGKSLGLARWKLGLLMFGNSLAVFCVALDNTIMSNAIPKITQTFHSLEDVGWYSSIYFFTNCSVILLFGKLYTHYSMKWIFLVALALFEIGSLICGAALSSVALIVGRAIAGLGAGGILPGAILIISESVPLHRRPLYTSALGGMSGVAAVVGPLIGGAFTQNVTWRWCFYINLPLGAITTVLILCFFVDSQAGTTDGSMGCWDKFRRLDIPGLLIFIPTVFCLLLPLQWGGVKYPWSNVRIIVLFVIFVLAATFWISIECCMKEKASVPPRLIRERNVWSSALYMACIVGSFIIILYYFPIWFQAVKGGSPIQSGTMILPIIIGLIICMTLGAVFVTAVGYYHPIMAIGTIISTIGAGLCTTLDMYSSPSKWIGYQAMCGIGLGFGFQLPFIAVQTALPKSDIPVATAIVTFAQNLSEAVLVALGQTIFQNRLLTHIERLSPSVDPHAIVHGGAANLDQRFPAEVLPEIVRAYSNAVTDTFYVATAIAALSVIGLFRLEWLSVKKKGSNENAAQSHP